MPTVNLDSAQIKDWETFHSLCKKEFGFPDFYGMNMNAWIDCLSYLDEDDLMTRFNLTTEEMLQINVSDSKEFKFRLPEIFEALVECVIFVNRRYIESGKSPVLLLLFF